MYSINYLYYQSIIFYAGGFLSIDEILEHNHFKYKLNATKDKIYKVVNNNDKKRFEIFNENGIEKIKAVQGHSVQVC